MKELRNERKELITTNPARYRGLALLAADLFLQLTLPSKEGQTRTGFGIRCPVLAEITTDLLRTLAESVGSTVAAGKVPDKEDVRAVVQALKVMNELFCI